MSLPDPLARWFLLAGLFSLLAGCQPQRQAVELQPLVACPVIDGSLFAAGELPDGLPDDPADAVLALLRCCLEARQALVLVKQQLEEGYSEAKR